MLDATGYELLQKTLLKLPEEKSGEHQIKSSSIILITTYNYPTSTLPEEDKDRRNVGRVTRKNAEPPSHRWRRRQVTQTRNTSIKLRDGLIGKMIEYAKDIPHLPATSNVVASTTEKI